MNPAAKRRPANGLADSKFTTSGRVPCCTLIALIVGGMAPRKVCGAKQRRDQSVQPAELAAGMPAKPDTVKTAARGGNGRSAVSLIPRQFSRSGWSAQSRDWERCSPCCEARNMRRSQTWPVAPSLLRRFPADSRDRRGPAATWTYFQY